MTTPLGRGSHPAAEHRVIALDRFCPAQPGLTPLSTSLNAGRHKNSRTPPLSGTIEPLKGPHPALRCTQASRRQGFLNKDERVALV
jgi:hypothetical protein